MTTAASKRKKRTSPDPPKPEVPDVPVVVEVVPNPTLAGLYALVEELKVEIRSAVSKDQDRKLGEAYARISDQEKTIVNLRRELELRPPQT